jgi:flagellar basal-body rod modification protein FlgD
MSINPVTNTAAVAATTLAQTAVASSTGTGSSDNTFMLMLMAQLKNQNPMQPMQDDQMMSQMTQLNSLQTLQTMQTLMTQSAQSTQATYAISLIGKHVKAAQDDGSFMEGVVTGTSVENGQMLLHIGDETTTLGSVIEVKEA